ncbi:GNAT family N-acetyltransferase [Bacillus sp. CGMCC 1.16607]|uniref:GNAT family N-acetyltransferase n=1 Tax=Bacillus sp. CGMCC 1.16607 TaxID=3351842 RepID=UPI0036287725
MNTELQKFSIQNPKMEDAQEIMDLIALCDIEEIGVPDITLSDIIDMWNSIKIETDAWVVLTTNNKIVGYAFLEMTGEDRMDTCIFVHPDNKNLGIGSLLLTKVEERAVMLAKGRKGDQKLMNQIPFTNAKARKLVEERGYQFSRLYKRMVIKLDEQPIMPNLVAGLTISSFQPDKDEETLFEIYDETFRDSWGYSKKNFSEWIIQKKGEYYDPNLWYIVWNNSQPVAFLMSRMQDDGLFIDLLGVKRTWRRQGIGEVMLLHVFHEAYQAGQRTILLYVDSDSLTNAHSLYKRVGMTPDSQTAVYLKELS